jgi:hypothetical protein
MTQFKVVSFSDIVMMLLLLVISFRLSRHILTFVVIVGHIIIAKRGRCLFTGTTSKLFTEMFFCQFRPLLECPNAYSLQHQLAALRI